MSRCFQPTLGCNTPTNSAGADVLRLLGAMGPLTSLLSGEAHMGAMAVTERCIGATYPTRVKKKHVTPEEMCAHYPERASVSHFLGSSNGDYHRPQR